MYQTYTNTRLITTFPMFINVSDIINIVLVKDIPFNLLILMHYFRLM